jgi:hypothetical protein
MPARPISHNFTKKEFLVTYISIVARHVQKKILQHVQTAWIQPKYRKKIVPKNYMVAVSRVLGGIYSIIVAIFVKVKTRPSLFDHSGYQKKSRTEKERSQWRKPYLRFPANIHSFYFFKCVSVISPATV